MNLYALNMTHHMPAFLARTTVHYEHCTDAVTEQKRVLS